MSYKRTKSTYIVHNFLEGRKGMYVCICFKGVDVSINMVVMCDASDAMRYDRRTPELSNEAHHST